MKAVAIAMMMLAGLASAQERPATSESSMKPIEAAKPQLRIGDIDPKGQCESISKDRPELEPVEKACEVAVKGHDLLPNFVCDMKMTRKQPWRRLENIVAQLRYIDGEEELSDLKLNGQPTDLAHLEAGVLSTGEFAPPGLSVLGGASTVTFTFRGEEKSQNGPYLAFDYRVDRANNNSWIWHIPPYQYKPGFHGVLWIDKQTGLLEHVSLVAEGSEIETYVPTRSLHVSTDYSVVKLGDLTEYQLPVHAEVKSCDRFNDTCSEIVRDFVNCRKFAAKARIVE